MILLGWFDCEVPTVLLKKTPATVLTCFSSHCVFTLAVNIFPLSSHFSTPCNVVPSLPLHGNDLTKFMSTPQPLYFAWSLRSAWCNWPINSFFFGSHDYHFLGFLISKTVLFLILLCWLLLAYSASEWCSRVCSTPSSQSTYLPRATLSTPTPTMTTKYQQPPNILASVPCHQRGKGGVLSYSQSFKNFLISSPLSLITLLRTLLKIQTWLRIKSESLTWSIIGLKFPLQNPLLPLAPSSPYSCVSHTQCLTHSILSRAAEPSPMLFLVLGCSFPPSLTCYLLYQTSA